MDFFLWIIALACVVMYVWCLSIVSRRRKMI